MRAVWVTRFGPVDEAAVMDAPDPVPGPGQVVLDVRAAEANYPDLLVIEGRYQVKPSLPFIPGKAASGVVAALGPGVAGPALGTPVVAHVEYGAFAQRLLAPAAACCAISEGIGFDTAAALALTYQTAWFALMDRARLQPGESVLVLGASGGVGVASLQLARALGAGRVIAAVRAEADAVVARTAGADGVVLVGNGPEGLRDGLAALGGPVDVVIDPVGGAIGTAALRTLAWCGRFIVVGFAAGSPPEVRANYLLVKNISVCGLQWSDYRDRAPGRVAAAQAEIFRLHRAGRLPPIIDRVMPMTRFAEALHALGQGTVQGKLILDPAT